jgi:cytochrome c-type biogenesis protein CcsB
MLSVGLLSHTASIFVRMVLSGRNWLPIHNQYESYIAIAWFAVLLGFVVMLARRQWIFGAAAAAVGFVTMLVANTMPIPSSEIAPVAGILATSSILKFHVTITLASYGLITLGFVMSLLYLATYYTRGGPAMQLAAAGLNLESAESPQLATAGGAIGGGSSGSSPSDAHSADASEASAFNVGPHRLLLDLDRAQMVILQLAFWLLGVGILLGAYWADHAWGRWWAWDPKETWALITWIVYLIVIHVRIESRNRGLLTAWLSVLGFFVMLWCYWGVNLLLAGLHSYA